MRGKIQKIVSDRGFGFIQPAAEGGKSIFFHVSGLTDKLMFSELTPGIEVEYDLEDSEKGPRAVHIEPL